MNVAFKINIIIAIGCFGFSSPLIAAPQSSWGFVRIVDVMSCGSGEMQADIDGKILSAKGYQLGDVTGGVRLSVGAHRIRCSKQGVKSGYTHVTIAPNQTMIVVVFGEWVLDEAGQPGHWKTRMLRLMQQDPEEGKSATFVSVSQQATCEVGIRDPDGQWQSGHVERLNMTKVPILYPRGYVPVRVGGKDVAPIPVAAAGNYVVLLYDDAAGHLASLSFKDRKFLSVD